MSDTIDFKKIQADQTAQKKEKEKRILKKNSEKIEAFISKSVKLGADINERDFKYEDKFGIYASHPNLLLKLQNNITPDKEGLYNWKELTETFEKKQATGFLYSDNYGVMAHRFFKRGYHFVNGYTPDFIAKFWQLNNEKLDAYIKLDTDNIKITNDDICYFELDHWYGAKFNKKIEDIPDAKTLLIPPECMKKFLSVFFSNTIALDIEWKTKNRIKSFYLYEIKNSETKTYYKNKEYYPVRYIHAEYDLISKSFRHFDGALQLLTEKEYYQLFTENVYETKNQKLIKAKSLKLFKINGQINIDLWQDFCCHFLSGNPLIHEYFTGKLPDNIEDAIIKLTKPSPTIPP